MDAAPSGHPTREILRSFGLGRLDEPLAKTVNDHLERCPACRKQVAELSADGFLGRVRDAQATDKSTDGKAQVYWSQSLEGTSAAAPLAANTIPPGLAGHPDYEIKRELGRGGMGVVYLAHNTLMGRDEVLKVMGRQIMDRPGVLDRFLREIRAVAQLRHPNIVTAYHATRLGDSIVFAMEYVAGLDLSRMLKSKGPMPVAHACYFAHQAALGLQHAHEEGLVHRDIKPGNLMLSHRKDKATIKILDFGLARVTREEKVDFRLTSEGQALGTPDYIAPEQIVDSPSADIRADIYSLGATLYHLLTGRPPFQAGSLYDMYQAHMSRDADFLNLVRPEVSSELAALVAKMMAKEPAGRFQTPGEVARALVPFFKRPDAASKSPNSDVFQASQSTTSQLGGKSVSAPVQPATESPGATVRPGTAAKPALVVPRQSLIPFRKTELSHGVVPTGAVEPTRRRPSMSPAIIAATMFGFVILAVIVVITRNNRTTIVADRGEKTISIKTPASGKIGGSPNGVRQNHVGAPEAKPHVSGATELIEAKAPAPLRLDSRSDPVLTGSEWLGTRRFVNGYVQGCELKITSRGQTHFEGEMALSSGIEDRNCRFRVKVRGDINGEIVKFRSEQKEHFQQDFEGKLVNKQMSLEFSGMTKEGKPAEGTTDLTLKALNASQSPQAGKAPRIVASWFAVDDADGWYTSNHDGSRDATSGLRVECNPAACWLVASDITNRKVWGWDAPPKYLGDHSEKFGRFLTYRILTNGSDLPLTDVYVRLAGGEKEIFVEGTTLGRPFPGDWKTYAIRLDASGGWMLKTPNEHGTKARDADIKYVLSRMTRLWIKGEYANGPDEGSLRYVQFGGAP